MIKRSQILNVNWLSQLQGKALKEFGRVVFVPFTPVLVVVVWKLTKLLIEFPFMSSRSTHLEVCVLVLLIEFRVTLLFLPVPLVNDETLRKEVSSMLRDGNRKENHPVLLTAVDAA
jgi:hypothetical protein